MSEALRVNIKAAMAERGLGLRALARAAGVSHGGLSPFLAGRKHTLALDTVDAIADALQMSAGALLGDAASPAEALAKAGGVVGLPLGRLRLAIGLNPRSRFDPEELEDLARSIAAHGVLQNLVARPDPGLTGDNGPELYQVVAGERRLRACQLLAERGHWPEDRLLPVRILEASDLEHRVLALLENLQRRDLEPLEEAEAFRQLQAEADWSTEKIAEAIGRSQRHVQQRLQLLELGTVAQNALITGKIGPAIARHLARLDVSGQQSLVDRIVGGTMAADEAAVRQAVGAWLAAGETRAAMGAAGQMDLEDLAEETDEAEPGVQDEAGEAEAAVPNEYGVYPREACEVLEFQEISVDAYIYVVLCEDGAWRSSFSYQFLAGSAGGVGSLPWPRDTAHDSRAAAIGAAAAGLAGSMAATAADHDCSDRQRRAARKAWLWAHGLVEDHAPGLLGSLEPFPAMGPAGPQHAPAPEPDPEPAPERLPPDLEPLREALAADTRRALDVLAASMLQADAPVVVRPLRNADVNSRIRRYLDQADNVHNDMVPVWGEFALETGSAARDPVALYHLVKALPEERLLALIAHLTAIRVGPGDTVDWQGNSLLAAIAEDLGIALGEAAE